MCLPIMLLDDPVLAQEKNELLEHPHFRLKLHHLLQEIRLAVLHPLPFGVDQWVGRNTAVPAEREAAKHLVLVLVEIVFGLSANLSESSVSAMFDAAGPMLQIISVTEFPPRLS